MEILKLKKIAFLGFFLVLLSTNSKAQDFELQSPDKELKLSVSLDDKVYYTISAQNNILLKNNSLGMKLKDEMLGEKPELIGQQTNSVEETHSPEVPLKYSKINNHYNNLILEFEGDYAIEFRAYNEGVAYRFITEKPGEIEVLNEDFHLNIPDAYQMHLQQTPSFKTSYEHPYSHVSPGELSPESNMSTLPVLLETDSDYEILISESDLYDYPGMFLKYSAQNTLASVFPKQPLAYEDQGLRDSSAQVWPYMAFVDKDEKLKNLIAGVINRQTKYILKDPYANAFYDDPNKKGEWFSDQTDMKPGVHERKWEIDSLCYPIRLGYHYWKSTGDTAPFDQEWKKAIQSILHVFRDQQKKNDRGEYSFQRETTKATDTRALQGYGYPVNPVGLICSAFRPSDDATVFSFLIPSNFFAIVSLEQAAEMMRDIQQDSSLSEELLSLRKEVKTALEEHAIVDHKKYGKIYAFEVDGFGNKLLMDDANVPSLLALPYLGAVDATDEIYQNTRNYVWSKDNPFFFKGTAGEGIGGPHVALDMIWPMSITMKGLTSNDEKEIKWCVDTLKNTHGNTGFMHETFHKDDPTDFTRAWFAWANTLFGEFLWKTYQEKPHLLA